MSNAHVFFRIPKATKLKAVPIEIRDTPQSRSAPMRALYLDIVKRWHPDHATDIKDFMVRNHITALANRAFQSSDLPRLRDLATLKQGKGA